nr:hypothetical protein [Tanacetum cinerariifolium]
MEHVSKFGSHNTKDPLQHHVKHAKKVRARKNDYNTTRNHQNYRPEAHRHQQSHGSEGISRKDCKKHPRSKTNQVLLYTAGPTGPALNGTWYMSA